LSECLLATRFQKRPVTARRMASCCPSRLDAAYSAVEGVRGMTSDGSIAVIAASVSTARIETSRSGSSKPEDLNVSGRNVLETVARRTLLLL